jgi:hypothetical protein
MMMFIMRLLMGIIMGMIGWLVMGMFVVVVVVMVRMLVFVGWKMRSFMVMLMVLHGRGFLKGMEMLKTRQMRCWKLIMLTVGSPCLLSRWLADGDHILNLGLIFAFDKILDELRWLLDWLSRLS